MEPVSRAGSCGNEPSGDRPGGSFLVGMPMFQKIRFAANKPKSTEPDVSAVTVMLSTLHRAVDSTIGKRAAGAAACFDRATLGFVCFFAAIHHP